MKYQWSITKLVLLGTQRTDRQWKAAHGKPWWKLFATPNGGCLQKRGLISRLQRDLEFYGKLLRVRITHL